MMRESDVVESVNASVNASVNSKQGYIPGKSDKRCRYCIHYEKEAHRHDDRGGCHAYYRFLKQRRELDDEDSFFRAFVTFHGKKYIVVFGDGIKPMECPHFQAMIFPEVITMHVGRGKE